MKLRLKLLLSFALSLLPLCSTQGCKSYHVRGFIIQLDSGPRNITVSLEKNQNMDLKLAHYRVSRTFRERMCHVINIKKRVCRRGGESLHLFSYASSTWTLDCPPDSGGRTLSCSGELHPQRLQAVLLGLDSGDFAFKWRPNDMNTSVLLSWETVGEVYKGRNPAEWNDFLVSRGVSGRPCRVYSEALNVNLSCDAAKEFVSFGSFNEVFINVASDFALPCEYLPEDSACSDTLKRYSERAPGTPSPGVVPPKPPQMKNPWRTLAIVALVVNAVVLVSCAVVLVVVKVRKSKPSRQAAITADDLHDPGRDDDREDEHIYCYIDMADLRSQLEEERSATHTQPDRGTTGVRRHNSENSLYGAILPRVRYNSGNSSEKEIISSVSLREVE